jgi:hypothetical protein
MYNPKYECFCPFYKGEYRKSVLCDGIAKNEEKLIRNFTSEEEKYNYIKKHCINDEPGECPIFKILMENYGAD